MHTSTLRQGQRHIPFKSLWSFLWMTFGLTWSVMALLGLFTEPIEKAFGGLSSHHPLFILAVYAPAIATFLIIIRRAGLEGLQRYLSRALHWQCSSVWAAFLLVGVPAIFVVGAY